MYQIFSICSNNLCKLSNIQGDKYNFEITVEKSRIVRLGRFGCFPNKPVTFFRLLFGYAVFATLVISQTNCSSLSERAQAKYLVYQDRIVCTKKSR